MREINVAIVGCGRIANEHLKIWQKVPQARIAASCDRNESAAKNVARLWRIPHYYTSFSELLKQTDVNLVDVCTPPQTHAPLAVQALESKFHVLLEKPMAMTMKDAKEIMSRHKISGTKLGVIHNALFEPPMIKAKSLIRKRKLGRINHVEVRVLHTNKDSMLSNKDHWCHSLPGGRFGEMLPHPIYVLQAFLGRLKVKEVFAAKIGDYPWVSADELHVILEAHNAFGSIYASFNSPRDAMYIDVYGSRCSFSIELVNKTLIEQRYRPVRMSSRAIDNLQQAYQLVRSTAQATAGVLSGRWKSGHEVCIRLFAKSVLSGGEPPVTAQEAFDTVTILDQICHRIDLQTCGS